MLSVKSKLIMPKGENMKKFVLFCLSMIVVGIPNYVFSSTFSSTDFTGTWYMHYLISGDAPTQENGWGYGKIEINSSGNTAYSTTNHNSQTNSGTMSWFLSIDNNGIITRPSTQSIEKAHGVMSDDKKIFVYTQMEQPKNQPQLYIYVGRSESTTQSTWIYSNSVGPRNSIKITDMSGSLSSSGASITVSAWDTNGTSIPESSSAISLKLYSNGTTTISGTDLRDSFPTGTPMTYALSADSAKYIITNVKSSSDNTLNVPNGYTSGTTKFVANSVGPRNSIKITDMSGTLSTPAAITVNAWDASGISIPEAASAIPLTLSNNGTTTITGNELIARFPTTAPMSYEFTIGSSKYVITNVKSSADGTINIPYAYTSGTTTFVANSIGPRNTIKISDVSGSLSSSGAAITVAAWDINGNAIPESATAALKLYSRGTTIITGTALAARFTGGTPMAYEFTVSSSKYIITNIKSSSDSSISIPAVYTSGTTMYASNDISFLSTIKITDASGSLSSPAAITVNVWDVNGNSIAESTSAIPLTLVSNGTTTITGTNLIARFPTGTPALYEFTIGSTKYLVTNVTSNTAGTITIPSVYSSGVAGGI